MKHRKEAVILKSAVLEINMTDLCRGKHVNTKREV
jgi:hypothetical protein